jgi:hypothetical protein
MEWRTRSGVSFFGAAEYTVMSDQANTSSGGAASVSRSERA